jgi:hypothetical protein
VKTTLLASFAALAAVSVVAQVKVNLNNQYMPLTCVSAPVYGPEPSDLYLSKTGNPPAQTYGGPRLEGSDYVVQLYAAPGSVPESSLGAIPPTTTFRTGGGGGWFNPVTNTVLFVQPGDYMTVQVRVWDNTSGLYRNWTQAERAWQAGLIAAGKSPRLILQTALVSTYPNPLCGLQSFNIYFLPPPIPLDWTSLDGGGGVSITALGGQLVGTIGQPDAGLMGSGNLTLVGGFLAQYGVAAIQLPLKLIVTPTNTVVITWPLPDIGYKLQTTSDLSFESAWAEIPPPYLNNGTELFHVEPYQDALRFFRLHRPSP